MFSTYRLLLGLAFFGRCPRTARAYGCDLTVHNSRPRPGPTSDHDVDVIIVGGSIVGLAAAAALSAPHLSPPLKVVVLERARRVDPAGALLSIFPNGLTALESIDAHAAERVRRASVPLRASEIKSGVTGETIGTVESGNSDEAENGVFLCWHELQQILSSTLRPSFEDIVRLGTEFISYDIDNTTGVVTVAYRDRDSDDAELHKARCRVLIGADGVQSSVRRQLTTNRRPAAVNSYNRKIFRALLEIDALDDASIVPQKGTAVIYKGDEVGRMFKIWTATDSVLALTATVNSRDDDVSVRKWGKGTAKEKMEQAYADFVPEVRDLIRRIPLSSIYANVVCDTEFLESWSDDSSIVVIGDAAHGMTPSLGQGANVGLEDAAEVGCLLRDAFVAGGENRGDIAGAIQAFVCKRRERVREIHEASRAQALNKNKQDATLSSFRKREPAFFKRLYGWRPARQQISPSSHHRP